MKRAAGREAEESATATGMLTACVALLCLLGLTLAAARFPLGRWNLILAMAIAGIKALILALYFMDLRRGRKSIWLYPVAGAFMLLILAGLAFSDYLTRAY